MNVMLRTTGINSKSFGRTQKSTKAGKKKYVLDVMKTSQIRSMAHATLQPQVKKKKSLGKYHQSTLAAGSFYTTYILFVKMLKICEKYMFQRTKFGEKETFGGFRNTGYLICNLQKYVIIQ
jgi:hypothetical protein